MHPNIKITITQRYPGKDLNINEKVWLSTQGVDIFLDTIIRIIERQIVTDLHRNTTDRNEYFLTNSILPRDCMINIPYSLALRINSVCKKTEKTDLVK